MFNKKRIKLNRRTIVRWVQFANGYTILSPQFCRELGMPENMVQTLAHTFAAHGAEKEVWGIEEFDAVNAVADHFGTLRCPDLAGADFSKTCKEILAKVSD